MIVCRDLMEELNRLAPPELACDWDNPGLLVGRCEKEVNTVLTALDVTDAVVEQAVKEGADLIIAHHPLIFHAVKNVNDTNFTGRRVLRLIQNDINVFAMHTNFDIAPGCMADLTADILGMTKEEPLQTTGVVGMEAVGIGKVGFLKDPVSLGDLAAQVKEKFGLPFVTVYGCDTVTGPVRRVAICPGSGRDMAPLAAEKNASVLITGDIGHHEGIDAAADGVAVIDAGHYGLEHIFISFMKDWLAGTGLAVITADPDFPQRLIV